MGSSFLDVSLFMILAEYINPQEKEMSKLNGSKKARPIESL
jgi:hypothetical protein